MLFIYMNLITGRIDYVISSKCAIKTQIALANVTVHH